MEKKLKYLLWAWIVWLWLLINKSFAIFNHHAYVEAVTLPFTESSFSASSNYLYNFNNQHWWISYEWNKYNFFVYSLYYDWQTNFNYTLNCPNNWPCPTYTFNDSAFGTWSFYNNWRTYANTNYFDNQAWAFTPIKMAFWKWSDKWKAFIYTNYLEPWQTSPKFAFGNWFFDVWDYSSVTFWENSSLNFARLFYNQNANLSSPLDWYDHIYSTWSNMEYSSWVVAFMQFTKNTPRYQTIYNTDVKYLVDYWSQGTKWLHFWGYWVWYTYAVNLSSDQNILTWWNWSFWNVWSVCGLSAMQLWYTSFDQISQNNCSNYWRLVLKGDSYVSRSNNASVIVLWKNLNNPSQILYEQYDCAQDDILRLVSDQYCNSISHWYITHNWSSEILPFTSTGDSYVLWSWNEFLDFMFLQWIYWNISIDTTNSQYCLNSTNSQYCFWLHATPNLKSLKERYLENAGDMSNTVSWSWLDDIVLNKPQDYYTYSWLVEYVMTWSYYSEDSWYIDNYVDYYFINWVPQLKDLKFWVCPFNTNPNFTNFSFDEFSFDFLVPHKCILAWLNVWYTSVNMSWVVNLADWQWKFIDERFNNENTEIVWHFVAILLILWISLWLFYILKIFK